MITYIFSIGWSIGHSIYLLFNYKQLIKERNIFMSVFYAITDIIGILSFCSVKVLGLILYCLQ